MKLLLLWTLVLMTVSYVSWHNPGLIGGIHSSFINSFKDEYIALALEKIQSISLDDVTVDNKFLLSGINFQILNHNLDNFQIKLDEEKNGIYISVKNTKATGKLSWNYKNGIINVSGQANADGAISEISILLKFGNQMKDGFLIPSVFLRELKINIDKNQWDFNIECSVCPDKAIDIAKKTTKGMLLKKMRDKLADFIRSRLIELINNRIQSAYPTSVRITDKLSISTGHTGPMKIRSDYIQAPFDATIFLTSEGYNRPIDAPFLSSKIQNKSGFMHVQFSDYIYDSLAASLSKIPFKFNTNQYGFDISIDVNTSKAPMKLRNSDGKLILTFSSSISIPQLYTSIDFESTIGLTISLSPGDDNNVAYILPHFDISTVSHPSSSISVFGWSLPLGPFSWLLSSLNEKLLAKYSNPTIRIPKMSGLSITAAGGAAVFGNSLTSIVVS